VVEAGERVITVGLWAILLASAQHFPTARTPTAPQSPSLSAPLGPSLPSLPAGELAKLAVGAVSPLCAASLSAAYTS
jgi:hypothetical protein